MPPFPTMHWCLCPSTPAALVHLAFNHPGIFFPIYPHLHAAAPLQSALVKLCFHIGGFLKLEREAPWWVQDGTFHSSHKCLKLATFRPIEHFHICDVWETAPGCDSFHFNCCLLLFSDLFDLVKCSLGLISNRPILFPQWNNSSQDRSQLLSQRTTSPQLHSLEMKMWGPF